MPLAHGDEHFELIAFIRYGINMSYIYARITFYCQRVVNI